MIDLDNIDDYAGEYVLGTLDPDEREEMNHLRDSNSTVSRSLNAWELFLTPLCERIPNEMPSPDLFAKIEKRLAALSYGPRPPLPPLPATRWHSLVLSFCLLLVMATGAQYIPRFVHWHSRPIAPALVAVLQNDPAKPLFVINADPQTKAFGIRSLTVAAPPKKDYELWIIPLGEKAPRPVGVVSNDGVRLPMGDGLTPAALVNATLAISIEPLGGSPTGLPTGPVIVTGTLVPTLL